MCQGQRSPNLHIYVRAILDFRLSEKKIVPFKSDKGYELHSVYV